MYGAYHFGHHGIAALLGKGHHLGLIGTDELGHRGNAGTLQELVNKIWSYITIFRYAIGVRAVARVTSSLKFTWPRLRNSCTSGPAVFTLGRMGKMGFLQVRIFW